MLLHSSGGAFGNHLVQGILSRNTTADKIRNISAIRICKYGPALTRGCAHGDDIDKYSGGDCELDELDLSLAKTFY
ncbi:hypothetical protein AV530_004125 [Patagioenas fasciata monilis]|uniref:Uncharacterized protein n=1 Tax=Patagioenas fasciata monilis TaxID=372326 RepID=A0A1V4JSI9_PATFA|nr:hypothetical protein AV530_004125 [Patagioenas fasciata monilis]